MEIELQMTIHNQRYPWKCISISVICRNYKTGQLKKTRVFAIPIDLRTKLYLPQNIFADFFSYVSKGIKIIIIAVSAKNTK